MRSQEPPLQVSLWSKREELLQKVLDKTLSRMMTNIESDVFPSSSGFLLRKWRLREWMRQKVCLTLFSSVKNDHDIIARQKEKRREDQQRRWQELRKWFWRRRRDPISGPYNQSTETRERTVRASKECEEGIGIIVFFPQSFGHKTREGCLANRFTCDQEVTYLFPFSSLNVVSTMTMDRTSFTSCSWTEFLTLPLFLCTSSFDSLSDSEATRRVDNNKLDKSKDMRALFFHVLSRWKRKVWWKGSKEMIVCPPTPSFLGTFL